MIRGRRRQVLIALSLGCFLSFGLNFWFVAVATPENFEDYMWLANVNEPGAYEAERIFRNLYLRFGERWSYRAAILGGYGVLVLMWTVVCFITLFIARLAVDAIKSVRWRRGGSEPCSSSVEAVAVLPHCPGSVPAGA